MGDIIFVDPMGNPLPIEGEFQVLRQYRDCSPSAVGVRLVGYPEDSVVVLTGEVPVPLHCDAHKTWWRIDKIVQEERSDAATAVGDLCFEVQTPDGTRLESETLHIKPANFTNEEYRRMMLEIGLIAVSAASWIHQDIDVDGVSGQGGHLGHPVAPMGFYPGFEQTIRMVDVLIEAMPHVERRPLHTVRLGERSLPPEQSLSCQQGIQRYLSSPSARVIKVPGPVESVDSTENRWLRWLVEIILIPRVESELELQSYPVSAYGGEFDWFKHDIESALKNDKTNKGLDTLKNRLNDILMKRFQYSAVSRSDLEEKLNILQNLRDRSPVLQVPLSSNMPHITERLLGHSAYRPIVTQWLSSMALNNASAVHGAYLLQRIVRKEVQAVWKCYESWCFVRLVAALHTCANFRTIRGQPTIADMIYIDNGEVCIRQGLKDALWMTRRHGEDPALQIRIAYQSELSSIRDMKGYKRSSKNPQGCLKPDILISFMNSQGGLGDFVFDAKYADYKAEKGRAWKDLWITARVKYLDGLQNASFGVDPMKIKSSFILHSYKSESKQFDYWGDKPTKMHRDLYSTRANSSVKNYPSEPGEELSDLAGHKIGLIPLRPDGNADRQLEKLIDLMLLYHINLCNFVCPRCGCQLKPGEDIRLEKFNGSKNNESKNIKEVGKQNHSGSGSLYCLCPDCGYVWLQNNCIRNGSEQRHLIIKRGQKMSFHMNSRVNKGMYVCPICGSDPSSEYWEEKIKYKKGWPPLQRPRDYAWEIQSNMVEFSLNRTDE